MAGNSPRCRPTSRGQRRSVNRSIALYAATHRIVVSLLDCAISKLTVHHKIETLIACALTPLQKQHNARYSDRLLGGSLGNAKPDSPHQNNNINDNRMALLGSGRPEGLMELCPLRSAPTVSNKQIDWQCSLLPHILYVSNAIRYISPRNHR